ncbi:phosphoenolpyruvate synthase [Candidatus Parcubacteria bacterium]|nr:MAG: phosphoenolpyruvate synthase [Candidatus Parcubacteria bacterium]
MDKKKAPILWFKELGIADVPFVGGKNAALGEMYKNLTPLGVNIPDGFAVTASAYRNFLKGSGLGERIKRILRGLDTRNIRDLRRRGKKVRAAVLTAPLPRELEGQIALAYGLLGKKYFKNPDVAVRSSATAEDLPGASFAGQQETYLNVRGPSAVLRAVKKCIASLFTDRAISYRADKGFSHFDAALSVGIQKMARSDLASSGVAFTIDTETGFDKVVVINGSYGLGEMVVQGKVTPDEFLVFKPLIGKARSPIIGRELGRKTQKMVYAKHGAKTVRVPEEMQNRFSLSDAEVLRLADWCVKIERHFSKKHRRYQPMDIEWAKDGRSGELFIVQARPETVHSLLDANIYREYRLARSGKLLISGIAVGTKIASGKVKAIKNASRITDFKKGEVLVTEITDPDWEPIMKIASAIVTDKGGRTSHAAIVSRELGIPCIVGSKDATRILRTGREITVDCSSGDVGKVYDGKLPYGMTEHKLDRIPKTRTKVMVNIGSPDEAFKNHFLPAQGVGLGRLEFIIASHVKIHPSALIDYPKLARRAAHDPRAGKIARAIEKLAPGYADKPQFYVDKLAEGISKIGAAFWPHEVIMRFSDFKTNEYRKLVGGELYEPEEENPMLGWRGASRYYDPKFAGVFGLECRAIRRVREVAGLKNVVPMVPFCRTVEEGKKVIAAMAGHGLSKRRDRTLKVYVMCEIPSNVVSADEFLDVFDGMSIGSNDLTQLVLGLDRDSGIVSHVGNETDPAVKTMIADVIEKCAKRKKYAGICGQAPSDHPGFAEFLVKKRIESISLNPDVVVRTVLRIAKVERSLRR